MDEAIVDSMCWIPLSWFSGRELSAVKRALSIQPLGMMGAAKKRDDEEEDPNSGPIVSYLTGRPGYIGVPVAFGVKLVARKGKADRLYFEDTEGQEKLEPARFPDPHHEKASPGQAEFIDGLLTAVKKYPVVLGEAATGSGKTVSSLYVAGKLGVSTLVIVPSKFLAVQWSREAKLHLGIPDEKIGFIEEGTATYKGKSIVFAVIHNLVQKRWSKNLLNYFGLVIIDEVHRVGARSFSKALPLFPSRYKLALTATPTRRDGCAPLFLNYFGEPRVVAKSEALACDCIVLHYVRTGKPYDAKIPRSVLLNIVSLSSERNKLIVKWIMKMYHKDRKGILVVSDRVEHLQLLMAMCHDAGVQEQEMGLFTRSYVDENGKRKQFTQADNDRVKNESLIIFATYGMMKEGVDIPRLDAGIEATPRSEGKQIIGRIRRPLPGKKRPVWVTIRDVCIPSFVRSCNARLHDYRTSNVQVIEYGKA
jgi:superfamily II DNA or RNA helicase